LACAESRGRLSLATLGMPLRAHRHDAGWLLGNALMEFVHTDPKTPAVRDGAMVLRYDADEHKAIISVRTRPGRNRGCGQVALSAVTAAVAVFPLFQLAGQMELDACGKDMSREMSDRR
jgi:hypothetical protein